MNRGWPYLACRSHSRRQPADQFFTRRLQPGERRLARLASGVVRHCGLANSPSRASIWLNCGLRVRYFTGAKTHSVAVRRLAREHGLKVNEYGVFRGQRRIAGKAEASAFRPVELPWIAPALRGNRGEIEAAKPRR